MVSVQTVIFSQNMTLKYLLKCLVLLSKQSKYNAIQYYDTILCNDHSLLGYIQKVFKRILNTKWTRLKFTILNSLQRLEVKVIVEYLYSNKFEYDIQDVTGIRLDTKVRFVFKCLFNGDFCLLIITIANWVIYFLPGFGKAKR